MKIYSVYFNEPVARTYTRQRLDKETGLWHDTECTDQATAHTFYTLNAAKAFIKANAEHYKGSSITSIRSNGETINHGEIKLRGSNKTFTANTRQITANY